MPVSPRNAHVACAISLILLLANCGEGPTGPGPKPGVRAVAGAGVTDTVDSQPLQALVVEVRGENGVLASGVVVRFEPKAAFENAGYYYEPTVRVCPLSAQNCDAYFGEVATDTTDAHGRAKMTVRLGRVAGPGVVRLVVPEFGLADSATFTITPGAPAAVRAVGGDPTLDIGSTATLSGHVVDRYENARTETPTLSAGAGSAIALNASTGLVTARDMGTQWVFMRYNALVDSARVRVVPPGRLLVWSSGEQAVRLVNINGTAERTIVTNVASDYGAFPQFDATRQHITLHAGSEYYGGSPNTLIVIDTTGASRRDIGPAIGFSTIMSTRYLADGTVLVVGIRSSDSSHPGFSLWRVATDNTITFVVALPGLGDTYGGADVSHDGTHVAYLATSSNPSELRLLDVASGSTTVLDVNANSPRWSAQDDRIVYLGTSTNYYTYGGVATIINTNGSGRKVLGNADFSPGISWSPDGIYVVGRASDQSGLRLVRVSDGAAVSLQFPLATSCCHDYWQPDWR
ncbi:MAG TPA: hypothetical protein VGN73_08865 [Gemmatimonadaceae bacterium]|nr:hypothetical protein [Gemmatimonadaceae bacterium]